jgi:hypothetical protein
MLVFLPSQHINISVMAEHPAECTILASIFTSSEVTYYQGFIISITSSELYYPSPLQLVQRGSTNKWHHSLMIPRRSEALLLSLTRHDLTCSPQP